MMTILNGLTDFSGTLALIFVTAIVTVARLRGWNGWLALRRFELERAGPALPGSPEMDANSVTTRIEMAHLKERIRKLEAIAEGIDL